MSDTIKAGVVSDTHLRRGDTRFAELAEMFFCDCDLILHAGDIIDDEIFSGVDKRIVAVRGNMDGSSGHPVKTTLDFFNKKIGLIHGYGSPAGMEMRIRNEFDAVDCIVFGHSHSPLCEYVNGILFFNPGAPFDRRWALKNTIGYLSITEAGIKGEIIEI